MPSAHFTHRENGCPRSPGSPASDLCSMGWRSLAFGNLGSYDPIFRAVILSDRSAAMGAEGSAVAFRLPHPPQTSGCPILAVILSEDRPSGRMIGVEGPASWNSGEGWDTTNASSRALYQGLAGRSGIQPRLPQNGSNNSGLQPLRERTFRLPATLSFNSLQTCRWTHSAGRTPPYCCSTTCSPSFTPLTISVTDPFDSPTVTGILRKPSF